MKGGLPFRIAQVILLLALLRHLLLTLFIHPYADDFSYAVAGLGTPLMEGLLREYSSWNGRYASNILVLRGPLVLGIDAGLTAYRAVAFALVLLTGLASYRFLRAMVPRLNKEFTFTLALAWLLLYLHVMPDASEGFYWYTGAVTYQLANALSLFFLANWISAWRRTETIGVRWYVVQVLLLLWMAGSNEVHMAYLVIGHAVLVFLSRKEADPRRRAAIILLGVAIIAGMVVALAPGNATRESLFPLRHDVVRTLAYSVGQTGRWALSWALPLILPSILFLVLLRKGEERGLLSLDGLRWNRWAALALPFACLFVSMLVTYWPTGLLGQYRTLNMACFYFLPGWFLALTVWDRAALRKLVPTPPAVNRSWWAWVAVLVCTLFLFSGRDGLVTADLLGGRMARYDADMMQRYAMVRQAAQRGDKEVVLDPVNYPRSLVILPLDTDAGYWMNRSYATYFGVPAVRVSPTPPPPAR